MAEGNAYIYPPADTAQILTKPSLFATLEIEPRTSYMLDKSSTTELYPPISFYFIFILYFSVCVCMCSSVGTQIPAYTCALECDSQRSVLSVCLYSFPCYYSPLSLWRWHLTDSGYVDLARLAGSKFQESSCLCLVIARIAGTWHHSQVLREDLNTGPYACIASTFLTEPSPYSLYFLFWGRVSLFPGLSLSSL